MGFLDEADVEISKIITSTASEHVTQEQSEVMQKQKEGKCICTLANISLHRKEDLQDEEVSKEILNKFHKIYSKYPQIFSSNYEDFRQEIL